MNTFEHGKLRVEPGTSARGILGEVPLPTGDLIQVPYVVVNGIHDGPTLVVIAASHGNEIVGTGAAITFLRALDPKELGGTVVIVPVVNMPAVAAGTYVSPIDGVNMSGPLYWDPEPDGTTSRRLGAIIGPILQRADIMIDLHGNNEPCAPMSMMFLDYARDEATRKATVELGTAFGLTPIDMSSPTAHPAWLGPMDVYPVPTAMSRGIPALMVELTGARTLDDSNRGSRGLMAVLRSYGMLPDGAAHEDSSRIPGNFGYWGALSTDVAGLLWVRHPAGEPFKKGTVLLEVTDVCGQILQEIQSPVDGFCWWYPGAPYGQATHAVPAGTTIALLAECRNPQEHP